MIWKKLPMKYFLNRKKIKFVSQNIILIVVASVLITGCLPNVGDNTKLPKPEGEFKKGVMVSGFPPLPGYPKAKIIESYGSSQSFGASFVTDDNLVKVFDFYNVSFAPLGWTATAHKKSDTNIVFDVKNDKYAGQVIINTAIDGKTTAITIAVSVK